jgi:hypothetical protein
VEYEPKPLVGWIVRRFIAGPLQRRIRDNLGSLKALLEQKDGKGLPADLGGPAGASQLKEGEPPGDTAEGFESVAKRQGLTGA